LYGIVLVVNGRRRAGKVVDLVNLDIERERHIVPHEFKSMVIKQMIDIPLGTGEEIVDTDDVPAIRDQAFTEMRTEKAGTRVSRCMV
jgi:hypothetical protein